jgi:hypothetical protein
MACVALKRLPQAVAETNVQNGIIIDLLYKNTF